MVSLHPLELVTVLGAAVAAALALFAPDSRARLVAAWVLIGSTLAGAVVVGPRAEMFSVYLLAVILFLAAWLASRRVLSAPVRSVWRSGRGSGEEHVTEPATSVRWAGRLLLLLVALVLLAFPLGLLSVPASLG